MHLPLTDIHTKHRGRFLFNQLPPFVACHIIYPFRNSIIAQNNNLYLLAKLFYFLNRSSIPAQILFLEQTDATFFFKNIYVRGKKNTSRQNACLSVIRLHIKPNIFSGSSNEPSECSPESCEDLVAEERPSSEEACNLNFLAFLLSMTFL